LLQVRPLQGLATREAYVQCTKLGSLFQDSPPILA
jgi:hypothetical protein